MKTDWLWRSRVTSGKKLRCLQMISGIIPTRINENRGISNQQLKLCRRCYKTAETDRHILNECPFTKDLRTKRHNNVCDVITKGIGKEKDMRGKRWKIDVEEGETARCEGVKHLQPDLSIQSECKLKWIEVTCLYKKARVQLKTGWKKSSWSTSGSSRVILGERKN